MNPPAEPGGYLIYLEHVLLNCIFAVTADANSYRAIARFIEYHFEWLQQHTGLTWRNAPRHTSLRWILLGLDHAAVEKAMRANALRLSKQEGATIAIDGKTLRGSLDRFADINALQWLSAFATEDHLVLGQVAFTGNKEDDEMTAAQELISSLVLEGKLFTLDALHCQKNTWDCQSKRQ